MSEWPTFEFNQVFKTLTVKGKIQTSDMQLQGCTPVIDQSEAFVAGYTDDDPAYSNPPYIVFGDHTRVLKYVDFPFSPGADGTKILQVSDARFEPKFAYFYLSANPVESLGYSRHFKLLKELQIPLPPLAEQRRIAEVLGSVDAALGHTDQKVVELTEAVSSLARYCHQRSEWDKVPLSSLCEVNPVRDKQVNGEVSFVGMAEMDAVNGTVSSKLVDYEGVKSGYTYFRQNDILLAKITPCFENSKIGIATIPTSTGVGSTEFHVLRTKNPADTYYLLGLLKQDEFLLSAAQKMTGSAGQRRVPANVVSNLQVPVPPKEVGKKISSAFETIFSQLVLLDRKLNMLNELKTALSVRAFDGQL